MKKFKFIIGVTILFVMLCFSSCAPRCDHWSVFSGKAIVVANSVHTSGISESRAYATVAKSVECDCLYTYHSSNDYKKGDTLYIACGEIVGKY